MLTVNKNDINTDVMLQYLFLGKEKKNMLKSKHLEGKTQNVACVHSIDMLCISIFATCHLSYL